MMVRERFECSLLPQSCLQSWLFLQETASRAKPSAHGLAALHHVAAAKPAAAGRAANSAAASHSRKASVALEADADADADAVTDTNTDTDAAASLEQRKQAQRRRFRLSADWAAASKEDEPCDTQPRASGAIDAKVTQAAWVPQQRARAISSPSHAQLAPFSWSQSQFAFDKPALLPDVWDFDWRDRAPAENPQPATPSL
jgi:hypothetical protein